ncbi:hypothetical protein GCM10009069_29260 [Algimonas arctica]|uniref:Uncharacterized protein n=1 Tax=Algimonas arctica TaxID=1479486 RepID=A0A8J3CTP5_9PROT|nr:hypothetical protein [Algimonas arctica]GHB04818.1 hypothetical protein GCM10009069_29260 [Algimonas arctica]
MDIYAYVYKCSLSTRNIDDKVMIFRTILKAILLIAFLYGMYSTTAAAQIGSSVAYKEGGKFNAVLYPLIAPPSDGFMLQAELDFTWWSLLGQPVYYNIFTWEIHDTIQVDLGGNNDVPLAL